LAQQDREQCRGRPQADYLALAGAIVLALLAYAVFRRWCDLRGAPPKGAGNPMIYSQYYLMAHGFAVTWDNPDIWLSELPASDGTMVPVASQNLLPNHVYRIHARIYNGSLEAPAVGMPVFFSFLTFGIGIVPTLIGVTLVNLPVKGAAGHPAETFVDWRTPVAVGHYCIQVGLFWLDDAEPANNLGQENVDVKKLASPAVFGFPLRNDAPGRRHFRLEVDAYPPPVPPPCAEPAPDATEKQARDPAAGIARLAAHRREANPLPPGWSVAFSPAAEFVLAGGEQIDIVATVSVSGSVAEPQPVNVNAFADGVLAGGVTLFVHS
jgi:hypothetical protein